MSTTKFDAKIEEAAAAEGVQEGAFSEQSEQFWLFCPGVGAGAFFVAAAGAVW